jgi:hypothetical protein
MPIAAAAEGTWRASNAWGRKLLHGADCPPGGPHGTARSGIENASDECAGRLVRRQASERTRDDLQLLFPYVNPASNPQGILQLPVNILPQPDEITCGPTCLHAVYRYWGEQGQLTDVIGRAGRLEHGGTLAVFLACDALGRGYAATIYTYNLNVFDPSWFRRGVDIAERLRLQREIKMDYRLQHATTGYLEFLALGGRLRLLDLSRGLIRGLLRRGLPVITGLSSTFLYRVPREYGPDDVPDDVRGLPAGHFVVIAGYDAARRKFLVVDPYQANPYASTHEYWLSVERVLGAVLLGIVTHDANLLIIHPRTPRQEVP